MQEQVRKNFDTFERAFGMFTPFSGTEGPNAHGLPSPQGGEAAEGTEAKSASVAKIGAKPGGDDIDMLKAELLAMQQRLEKLSRS